MAHLFQQILDGLGAGALYALLALALVFVFRSTGIINFAQGEMALFSTYIGWQFTSSGVPPVVAILLSMVAGFLIGAVVEGVVVRRVEGQSHLTIIIVTFGLFIGFNSLAGIIWGYLVKSAPSIFPSASWDVAGTRISAESLGTIATLVVVLSVLYCFFQYTSLGLALRAVASNPQSSGLVGIRVGRMLMIGWGLSAALGAIAGSLAAPRFFLEPNMMFTVLIYAFAAAIVGGLDSPIGAVVGGLVVGVAENLAGSYVPWLGSDLKVVLPLLMIAVVLTIRPTGLFGSARLERV